MNREARACNDQFRCASFGFFGLFLLLVPYNKQLSLGRYGKNLKPRPTVSLGQYGEASVRDFPRNDLTLGY